ncbi:RRP12-like protein [Rhagoletis pomonella]|uniref:RRP12-like protein n=1 Tax=Rhagoletis pomonella TaxID=28610 RepID=UPI0017872CB8|nr:RRP12-like protein [Rhagoletis pomonella]
MRLEKRKQLNEKDKTNDDDTEDEFVTGLEYKSTTSDSDLPEDLPADNAEHNKAESDSTFVREYPEDIVLIRLSLKPRLDFPNLPVRIAGLLNKR